MIDVSVLGVGYVGAVSAACLARDGFRVVCADPNSKKLDAIGAGLPPIVEPGLQEVLEKAAAANRIFTTSETTEAVLQTDLSLVCVGTPSRPNGSLDTAYVVRAAEDIGSALRDKRQYHSVVVRSTLLPGTMREVIIPTLERTSGKRAGVDFGVAYYPEFLREGSAIKDYYAPGTILFGHQSIDSVTTERLRQICSAIPLEPILLEIAEAEAIKYANNCWHALKISFANEIGNICKAAGLDSFKVLQTLCSDTKLNISPAYLKPGFAFGGSCLPKDLRAIRYRARELDIPTPVLDATLAANDYQIQRAFDMIVGVGARKVGLVGLSFKPGTDDLRESPFVELAERLHGKGYDIRIFDSNIEYRALTGANLHFIRSHLPHLVNFLVADPEEFLQHSEVIVIGKPEDAVLEALANTSSRPYVIDLVRSRAEHYSNSQYEGICW